MNFFLRRPRLLSALLIAAAVTLCAVGLYVWSDQHDNPRPQRSEVTGRLILDDVPILVRVDCTCPTVLTASRLRTLSFRFRFPALQNAPPTADSGQRDVYVNWNIGGKEQLGTTLTKARDLMSGREITSSLIVLVTPPDTTLSEIEFRFYADPKVGPHADRLGTVSWPISSQPRSVLVLVPYGIIATVFGAILGAYLLVDARLRRLRERADHKVAAAEAQAESNPERARFAWDLARTKLEAYVDRNLIQVNSVFWVALFVMLVGFGFVLGGVVLSYSQPRITPAALVAAISGVVAQFIGVTFMVIYRSTIKQANEFMTILERINTVGMAVQVLDSLQDGTNLKDTTRANLAVLLIGGRTAGQRQDYPSNNLAKTTSKRRDPEQAGF